MTNPRQSQPSNLSLKESIECISSQNKIHWAIQAHDPYIYVSFSYKGLTNSQGDIRKVLPKSILKVFELDKKRQKELRDIVRREWVERAKLPVKLLPNDATVEQIKSKNVVFVIGFETAETLENISNRITPGYTFPPIGPYAKVKFILLSDKPFSPLTKDKINTFLHETGHAIPEFKHYLEHQRGPDTGPYCPSFDCDMTVMSYSSKCRIAPDLYLRDIRANAAPNEIDDILSTLEKKKEFVDKHNISSKVFTELYNTIMPIQLTAIDLAAAASFKEKWLTRLQHYSNQNDLVKVNEIQLNQVAAEPLALMIDPLQPLTNLKNDTSNASIERFDKNRKNMEVEFSESREDEFSRYMSRRTFETVRTDCEELLETRKEIRQRDLQMQRYYGFFPSTKRIAAGAITPLIWSNTSSANDSAKVNYNEINQNVDYSLLFFLSAGSAIIVFSLMYFLYKNCTSSADRVAKSPRNFRP